MRVQVHHVELAVRIGGRGLAQYGWVLRRRREVDGHAENTSEPKCEPKHVSQKRAKSEQDVTKSHRS